MLLRKTQSNQLTINKVTIMPVTKTAKRALRSSKRKTEINKLMKTRLEIAVRIAKKSKSKAKIIEAISMADRASKKHIVHKNKVAHIKSTLSKLLPREKSIKPKKASKKTKLHLA